MTDRYMRSAAILPEAGGSVGLFPPLPAGLIERVAHLWASLAKNAGDSGNLLAGWTGLERVSDVICKCATPFRFFV